MYYLLCLSTIFRTYVLIRYLHGAYVSYYFVKWITSTTYSNCLWVLSYIHKPDIQIDDKYNSCELNDGYIIIF